MADSIDNSADVIDSRDIIERIKELEEMMAGGCIVPAGSDWATAADCSSHAHMDGWEEMNAELSALKALAEEAEPYASDWKYGEQLIRDSYFTEYAEELARDCYDMKQAEGWPFRHIDWEAAAGELKQDYTSVDFDGVTYWVR